MPKKLTFGERLMVGLDERLERDQVRYKRQREQKSKKNFRSYNK